MSLAWDVLQHYQIEKARNAADIAAMKVDSLSARKDNTKQELEELTLACQAMWELLRDHIGFAASFATLVAALFVRLFCNSLVANERNGRDLNPR